jgi:hypothetical protein
MLVNPQQYDFFPDKMSLLSSVESPRPMVRRIEGQRSRQRGVVLTEHGWRKLLKMEVLQNKDGEWHTYELLGDRTLLSPRTVSKIVGREVGVDYRTLKQFFDAFNLPLESDDCCLTSYGAKPSSNPRCNDVAFVFYFRL